MNYSSSQLKLMIQKEPKDLLRILNNPNATAKTLASGVELLGEEFTDELIVLPIFRQLLKHINAVVRESAIIGVSSFYLEKVPPADILDRIDSISETDPSNDLKEYAKSILKDFVKMKIGENESGLII